MILVPYLENRFREMLQRLLALPGRELLVSRGSPKQIGDCPR